MYDNAVLYIKIALSNCFTFDKLAAASEDQFKFLLADI